MLHAFTDHRGQANCMSRSFRCFFPIMFVTRIARTFLFSSDPASVGKRLAAKGNQARACRSSNTVFIGWRLAETETERGLIWPRPTGAVLVTLILGRRVVYVSVAVNRLSHRRGVGREKRVRQSSCPAVLDFSPFHSFALVPEHRHIVRSPEGPNVQVVFRGGACVTDKGDCIVAR